MGAIVQASFQESVRACWGNPQILSCLSKEFPSWSVTAHTQFKCLCYMRQLREHVQASLQLDVQCLYMSSSICRNFRITSPREIVLRMRAAHGSLVADHRCQSGTLCGNVVDGFVSKDENFNDNLVSDRPPLKSHVHG